MGKLESWKKRGQKGTSLTRGFNLNYKQNPRKNRADGRIRSNRHRNKRSIIDLKHILTKKKTLSKVFSKVNMNQHIELCFLMCVPQHSILRC